MANTEIQRTSGSTPTNAEKFTISLWFKKSKNSQSSERGLLGWRENSNSGNNSLQVEFQTTDKFQVQFLSNNGNDTHINLVTNKQLKDNSSWYHLVIAVDSSQTTASDRAKIYFNGVQETSLSSSTYPASGRTFFSSDVQINFGKSRGTTNNDRFFNGAMSHIHFIDGTAYNASAFGETDATTGEWEAKTSPSVTYGNNGFFILKDSNSVTDQSGKGNNFTVGGGTLTNLKDNPDNNFATCSKEPIRTVSGTQVQPVLSNGNTTWDGTGVSAGASITLSTLGATTGKYYMEAKVGGSYANHSRIGVGTFEGYNGTTFFNSTSSNYVAYTYNGEKNIAGTTSSYGATYTVGDIISVALDCDNNTVTFYKNGASQGAINITNNDNFKHFSLGGYDNTGSDITNWICNFGNGYFGTTAVSSAGTNASGIGIFEYNVPSGFTALSTKGLNL